METGSTETELEGAIQTLETDVDALHETLYQKHADLDKLSQGSTTQGDASKGASIELSPEQKSLTEAIATMQGELTAKELKLQALKKRLAESIANDSEFFKEVKKDAND
jgi:prefoldin subunit 5